LKACVDKAKANAYFEKWEGKSLSPFKIKINITVDALLQKFILCCGCDL
jgi:hypothetical protein